MEKRRVRTPFFVVNPKAYLYGEEAVRLAKWADELAERYDIDIFFTGQLIDLPRLRQETSHLIITAQHLDGLQPGRGMGYVLADALVQAGVQATFLNHAEHPMPLAELVKAMERCHQLGILTIVCADTAEEGRALCALHPDVIVCEPTALIGTGQVSNREYMRETNAAVLKASEGQTLILQAAGISSGEDVYNALMSGADGTGATSGIVAARDPARVLEEMIQAVVRAKHDRAR